MGDVSDRGFCMKGPNQSEGSEGNRKAAGKKKIRSDFCLRQERVGEGTTRSDNRQRGRGALQRERLHKHMIRR